jgi:hypothetical protein
VIQRPRTTSIVCYLRERHPRNWPVTAQRGEPNCREPEALPHRYIKKQMNLSPRPSISRLKGRRLVPLNHCARQA